MRRPFAVVSRLAAEKQEIEIAAANKLRPEIVLVAGRAPQIVDEAEKVLVDHAEPLKMFQRAGEVVRIISLSPQAARRAEKCDGVKRPEGAVVVYPVSALSLVETFDRLIAWKRYDPKSDLIPADCPDKNAKKYLSRVGSWKLPVLKGVIESPILRADGTILRGARL